MKSIHPDLLENVRGGFLEMLAPLLQAAPGILQGVQGIIGAAKGGGGAQQQQQAAAAAAAPPQGGGEAPPQQMVAAAAAGGIVSQPPPRRYGTSVSVSVGTA
jgi:hypothetical protein